jgi:hypothetical protein
VEKVIKGLWANIDCPQTWIRASRRPLTQTLSPQNDPILLFPRKLFANKTKSDSLKVGAFALSKTDKNVTKFS